MHSFINAHPSFAESMVVSCPWLDSFIRSCKKFLSALCLTALPWSCLARFVYFLANLCTNYNWIYRVSTAKWDKIGNQSWHTIRRAPCSWRKEIKWHSISELMKGPVITRPGLLSACGSSCQKGGVYLMSDTVLNSEFLKNGRCFFKDLGVCCKTMYYGYKKAV